ncbi:MAG: exopolysaccharide biosynthesis protein [Cyanobacteria bacterium P01_H01_bin.15]
MAKLSVELERYLQDPDRGEKISLRELLAIAGERVFGFLFVLIALPSALPIPAAGYSIPFAIVIFFLALQLILGREQPWLPERFLKGSIGLSTAQGFFNKARPWLKRIERLAKPRLKPICTSLPGRIFMGVMIALMASSMMIPIPGTNTLPAIAIFVVGFGLQEDDGAICLAGISIGLVYICALIAGIILFYQTGANLYEILKERIKSLF